MSTLFVNHVQSTYARSIRRSATNVQASHIKQCPTTNVSTRQCHINVFNQMTWRRLEPSTPSETIISRRPSRFASISTITNTQSSAEQLSSDEIESLLQCLDRDDTFIIQVDCLANYRKLVQTIDLRRTPFDRKSLCALQQRENHIVQQNACRDIRFHALLDVLEPSHVIEADQNHSNDIKS